MTNIDPVPGILDPMLLRARRQAQLRQQAGAVERQGVASGQAGRAQYEAASHPDHQTPPEDGFRPDDQRLLRTLQGVLRRCLSAAGSPRELSRLLAMRLALTRPELRTLLHSAVLAHPADLGEAITWLVDNLDRPHVVSSGCAQLGPALGELLAGREDLDVFGLALLDAMRVSLSAGWLPEYEGAWQSTWDLVVRWIGQGMKTLDYEPPFWTGVVVSYDRRRANIAVLRLRTHLPYPFHPGQYAIVESALHKEVWRPYWIASPPSPDHLIEVHVRARPGDLVAEALVHRAAAGDRVRLHPAGGDLALVPQSEHALLLVAGGVGVAPMKALLAQLRQRGDERVAHLFWGVRRREDLYDLEAMRGFGATVVPAVAEGPAYPYHSGQVPEVVAAHGDWHANDVYVTGSAAMVRATVAVLSGRGVPPEHIVTGTTPGADLGAGLDIKVGNNAL